MRKVFSSHVSAIDYDAQSQQLTVEFQARNGKPGKTAVYAGVPDDIAAAVLQSESIGKALHTHVRGKYAHSYMDEA